MEAVVYLLETSPLICRANQWTGFYMIMASVMKELNIILMRQFITKKLRSGCSLNIPQGQDSVVKVKSEKLTNTIK